MTGLNRKATHDSPLEMYFLTIAIFFISASSILYLQTHFSIAYSTLSSVVLLITGIYLLMQSIRIWYLRILFQTPNRSISCIEDEEWQSLVVKSDDGISIHAHAKWLDETAPLIFYLHGWSSNSSRSLNRCRDITGHHVLAMDLRGHGHAPDEPEFTAQKCAEDAAKLLDSIPRDKISSISIHGHSLGSYIAIRLQSRFEGWWRQNLRCLVLESPMTDYNLILKEYTPGKLVLLRPLIFRWMIKAWKKIHPEITLTGREDIKIPEWGRPEFPTLLIQAADDERLGMSHYELLVENMEHIKHEKHVIKGLRHSGDSIHEGRTKLMQDYLDRSLL